MFWVGVAVFLLGLLASIAWHELGHLVPAKRFGVLVPQYMIGFGPTLFSRRRGETEYGVKAIPLGGYIRMVGMYPAIEQLPPGTVARRSPAGTSGVRRWARTVEAEARAYSTEEIPRVGGRLALERTFTALPVGKRIVVMLGGPVANLVLGFVLLAVGYLAIGVPTATTTLASVSPCLSPAGAECVASDTPSPAAQAGLREGDEIVSWGGVPATSWARVQEAIRDGGTTPAVVEVVRDGERHTVSVTPQAVEREVVQADGTVRTELVSVVGITPEQVLARSGFGDFLGDFLSGLWQTLVAVVTLPVQVVSIISSTFGTAERGAGVMGLVGVGRLAGEAASTPTSFGAAGSVLMMLQLLASLNIALFAFNLVPLLPLDGGHVAGALWEGTRRRWARWRGRPDPGPVDTTRMLPITYVVITLFVALFVLLTIADLLDPVTLTG